MTLSDFIFAFLIAAVTAGSLCWGLWLKSKECDRHAEHRPIRVRHKRDATKVVSLYRQDPETDARLAYTRRRPGEAQAKERRI
jgi:hypothetical protein